MRAVVTGAAGFIGQAVVDALVGRGDSVIAFLRLNREAPAEWRGRVDVRRGDLGDAPPVAAMRGAEVAFHSAAQVTPTWDRERYLRNNVRATRNVLQAALVAGVRRVIHVSSLAVHGEHIDHRGADESAPFADPPPNAYVATKIEAERVAQAFRARGLDVVILRPGWVWGPRDAGIRMIARRLREGRFLLPGRGANQLHLMYVENLARAALLAADVERARNGTFIVHDDSGVLAGDFLRRLATVLGVEPKIRRVPLFIALAGAAVVEGASWLFHRDPPLTRYQVAILARNQGFSTENARTVLGFHPAVSLDEGMARVARWISAEGLA